RLFEHRRRLRDVPQMSLRHRREVFTTTQPRYSLSKPLNKKSRVCGFVPAEGASEQLAAGVAFASPALRYPAGAPPEPRQALRFGGCGAMQHQKILRRVGAGALWWRRPTWSTLGEASQGSRRHLLLSLSLGSGEAVQKTAQLAQEIS